MLQKQALALEQPSERAFNVFSDWFKRNRPFVGYSRDLVQEKSDFVSLKTHEEQDRLSKLMRDYGGRFLPVGEPKGERRHR